MGDHPDPLLRYMSHRLADPRRSLMNTAYELHMQSLGIDIKSDCKFTKDIPEAMIDAQLLSAKAAYATRTPLNEELAEYVTGPNEYWK